MFMDHELPKIPELPDEIIEAAKDDRLVVFVGTGPSISMGAADWNQFANNVLDQLREQEIINHAFIDQVSELDPRKKLSIAQSRAREKNVKIDYRDAVMPAPENEKDSKIYDHLIGIGSHFVTTNYDDYLDKPTNKPFEINSDGAENKISDSDPIYNPSELDGNSLSEPNTVIHLHGSFSSKSPKELVITTSDYLNQYHKIGQKENNGIQEFLEELFGGGYVILFVGYGLEELELLEYMLAKSPDSSKEENEVEKKQRTRFWLQGCYSHQKNTYDVLKNYYEENFDIEMILYSMDERKYDALTDIIAKWKIKINAEITPSTDKIKFANEAINDE